MNNFTSMFVAMLEHLKLLTEDEAKKLAEELHGRMIPDTYKGASAMLKDVYAKLDIQTIEKKLKSLTPKSK